MSDNFRFEIEIIVNMPRYRMMEYFTDISRLRNWFLPSYQFEQIEGVPGQVGSKTLFYLSIDSTKGENRSQITQTILRNKLPHEFVALYESKGIKHTSYSIFHSEGESKTRWKSQNEVELDRSMRKFRFFLKRFFPKQSRETMARFKKQAEKKFGRYDKI